MNIFNKNGFTLIELMIVVVILGVLMSTVLPKLTGGQARSRDKGRMHDLINIVAALNVYYDDYGNFPGKQGVAYCLPKNGDSQKSNDQAEHVSGALESYLQSKQVPTDMNNNSNGSLCTNSGLGNYYYAPLIWHGLQKNSFILCADVEEFHGANASVVDDLTFIGSTHIEGSLAKFELKDTHDTVEKLLEVFKEKDFTDESTHGAQDSVFCMVKSQ